MKINKYVVTYDVNKGLFDDYAVLEGKTPKEALKNAFNKDYERLTGDSGRYATIILIKGDFKNNTIMYEGRAIKLCFKEVE